MDGGQWAEVDQIVAAEHPECDPINSIGRDEIYSWRVTNMTEAAVTRDGRGQVVKRVTVEHTLTTVPVGWERVPQDSVPTCERMAIAITELHKETKDGPTNLEVRRLGDTVLSVMAYGFVQPITLPEMLALAQTTSRCFEAGYDPTARFENKPPFLSTPPGAIYLTVRMVPRPPGGAAAAAAAEPADYHNDKRTAVPALDSASGALVPLNGQRSNGGGGFFSGLISSLGRAFSSSSSSSSSSAAAASSLSSPSSSFSSPSSSLSSASFSSSSDAESVPADQMFEHPDRVFEQWDQVLTAHMRQVNHVGWLFKRALYGTRRDDPLEMRIKRLPDTQSYTIYLFGYRDPLPLTVLSSMPVTIPGYVTVGFHPRVRTTRGHTYVGGVKESDVPVAAGAFYAKLFTEQAYAQQHALQAAVPRAAGRKRRAAEDNEDAAMPIVVTTTEHTAVPIAAGMEA